MGKPMGKNTDLNKNTQAAAAQMIQFNPYSSNTDNNKLCLFSMFLNNFYNVLLIIIQKQTLKPKYDVRVKIGEQGSD